MAAVNEVWRKTTLSMSRKAQVCSSMSKIASKVCYVHVVGMLTAMRARSLNCRGTRLDRS